MRRLQVVTAIVCASTVFVTGIVPTGTISVDSFAAELDTIEASQDSEADLSVTDTVNANNENTESSEVSEDISILTADSYEELQEYAPADLDTASSYVVDLSEGQAEGSNAETVTVEEAFGVEVQSSVEDTLEAIEDTDLYIVDETDNETAVIYSPYARHRILVYTDEEIVDTFGATEGSYLTEDGGYRLCYENDEATKNAYEKLSEAYGMDAVVLDAAVSVSAVSTQPKGWGTSYMHLDGISQKTASDENSRTVTVAVLDSGILSSHEVFANKTISSKATSIIGDTIEDENGHGTAVAGIIAESTSDNVVLMPIKIADKNGESSLDYMLSGLRYAAENGADVANLSMNACYGDTTLSESEINQNIATLEQMMQTITQDGMVVCVSSGNDGRDINATYNYPAMSEYVLSVGSINETDQKSAFSSYGSALDFVAPGEGIECAWNSGNSSWKSLSGTSMSSPYVAAACAMACSADSQRGISLVENELKAISKDLGSTGKDAYFGYGVPVFNETATYEELQSEAEEGQSTLLDGISLPSGWEEDDPMSYKAYQQLYGSVEEEQKSNTGNAGVIMTTSSTTASTKWRIYDSSKYNASTKAHSGSTFSTFDHDSMNTAGNAIAPVIDVSYHNDDPDISSDNINWRQVKDEGVEGVFIRCGYRGSSSGSLNTDKQFFNFIKGAKAAGLKVGVYFFSQAITVSEGEKEAEYTIARVRESGVSLDLPMVIDVEYAGDGTRLYEEDLKKDEQTAIAKAFCAKVKKAGYTPMVYASSSFLVNDMDGAALADAGYQIWMARYRYAAYSSTGNFYARPVAVWQCSSQTVVNGIKTRVDANYWYNSNEGWEKYGSGWCLKDNGKYIYSKWVKNGGEWYYIDSAGYVATNTWLKDSYDWCYMNSDGIMARSKWVQSNGKWYYINSDGYMARNAWAKDRYGWCYMGSDGEMVYSKWIYYKEDWYYINSKGYMATDAWAKDRYGWCYMNSDGLMTYSKWIYSNGEWYYINSDGYMATNAWAKDRYGWCYMGSDGKMVYSEWIYYKGEWYYIKSNGYMAANEYAKDSKKTYWMNADGTIRD